LQVAMPKRAALWLTEIFSGVFQIKNNLLWD
jgi:hypothetical protein